MDEQLFGLQTYTPNSDLAAAFSLAQYQIIWGRTGNDTLLGYQPVNQPGQTQIDIFLGDVAVEDPAVRQWSDTFILGDWTQSYYANGFSSVLGLNDFGFISDFNSALDVVQLNGSPSDYQLLDVGVGSALVRQQDSAFDVVGFLLGNSNLSLASNYFNFQGILHHQGPVLPQTQQIGTSGFDLTPATATDTEGNVYIAGATNGSLEGANNSESRDALVTKYDSQGNLLFTKQFGTPEFDQIFSIDTDDEGNFYVAGSTEGNFGVPQESAISDAWVAKFDSDGNQQWIQQFGNGLSDSAYSIDVDGDGTVYLSGATVRPVDGEPIVPVAFQTEFWTSKYDTNGNRQWFTEVGTPVSFDESYGVTVSNDGSVYATGWTLGGNVAAQVAGTYDNLLTKYDNNGQVEWVRQFGTADYEWSWSVDTDSQGNVYATGWTLGNLGGQNAGSYDGFLTKYDSLGNQLWLQQFGSAGDDEPFDLFIDSQDNIFLTGYTNGNLGGTNAGSFDPWVAKYDTDGNQAWIQQFGTPDFDQAYSIGGDNAGNLFLTGATGGSFGNLNAGSVDSWLAKLDAGEGILQNFSGTSNPLNTFVPPVFPVIEQTDQLVADQAMVDFLSNFFEDFISSLGVEPDGTGLPNLIREPYGQPASVPEPSSGAALLMFAAISCVGAMLKGRGKNLNRSRTVIQ